MAKVYGKYCIDLYYSVFTRQSYIHSIVDGAHTEHPISRSELDHKDSVRVGKTWLNDWFLAPMGQLHLYTILASYYKPPLLVLKEYFVSCEQVTTSCHISFQM